MSSNRTLLIASVVVLIVLLALGGFALWLFGGGAPSPSDEAPLADDTGIVLVRVVDAFGDERLRTPVGIGADESGRFFVTLRDMPRIVEFDADGDYVRDWGERGLEAGQLVVPLGVAVDRAGGRVYVTDRSRLRLICYDLEGTLRWEVPVLNPLTPAVTDSGVAVSTFGPLALFSADGIVQGEYGTRGELPGQFDYARGIAILEDGAVIADSNNARVQRVRFSGSETTATVDWVVGRPPLNQEDAGTRFGVPASVTLDDDGLVYVLDGFRGRVEVLDPETGADVHSFQFTSGTAEGQLYLPSGIAHLGGDTFAITDTANDRVQIFRLLLPEEDNPIARSPWLLWLLLVPLGGLLALFGRKRFYVTEETLDRARDDERLRLIVAVLKRAVVLPDTYERYRDVREGDVGIGEYLTPVAGDGSPDGSEAALADAARPSGLDRLLLARHIVVCADDAQCERLAERKVRVRGYEEIVAEYRLEGAEQA